MYTIQKSSNGTGDDGGFTLTTIPERWSDDTGSSSTTLSSADWVSEVVQHGRFYKLAKNTYIKRTLNQSDRTTIRPDFVTTSAHFPTANTNWFRSQMRTTVGAVLKIASPIAFLPSAVQQ